MIILSCLLKYLTFTAIKVYEYTIKICQFCKHFGHFYVTDYLRFI